MLWALGDLDGPLSDEVKIGICKRRSLDSQVKAMRASRSRQLATRCEVYIRGECAALRLRTAVFYRLRVIGLEVGAPWFAAARVVDGIVTECAAVEGVTLLTEEQARELEQRELQKLMDQFA